MSSPDSSPKLPSWIFLLTDVVLVAAAVLIAAFGARPLSGMSVAAITTCVLVGAIVGLVPLVAHYEREKTAALDERQNALEALSRTVAASAEQISIAATGLHEIAELTQRNLKHAENLPHKLQEKIAEFQARLDNAHEDEREELEKELADLRAGETDRLESTASRITQSIAELARLDHSAQQQLAAARQALADIPARDAAAVETAVAAAMERIASVQAAALTEIEAKLSARTALVLTDIEAALSRPLVSASRSESLDRPLAADTVDSATAVPPPSRRSRKPRSEPVETGSETVTSAPPAGTPAGPETAAETPVAETTPPGPDLPSGEPSPPPPPPESDAASVFTPSAPLPAASETVAPAEAAPPTRPEVEPADETAGEPAPVPVEAIVQIEPVVPRSMPPFEELSAEPSAGTPAPVEEPSESVTSALAAPAPSPAESAAENPVSTAAPADEAAVKPARKRAPKRASADAAVLPLGLVLDDFSQTAPEESAGFVSDAIERVISSDGATRLLVTAYIGIGNRLFIRGDGPGLTWEKGVPLQFVSIGKWRWETMEAATGVRFRLYKNDDVECTALGELMIEPGQQQEVTAKF